MATVTFILPDGSEKTVEAKPGDSVMQTAVSNNVNGIVAECSGSMMCATCHVHVADGWLDKTGRASEDEEAMLEFAASEADASSRLSCQIRLDDSLDGLVVRIPETQI